MASQTAPTPPFARFSRGGFGFAARSDTKKKAGPDDEWYIPYNGPYELPRDQPRREKARDSWGDVLEDVDDAGVLGDRELQMRYGGGGGGDDFASRASSSGRYGEDERKGRTRDRTFSGASGRTMSSGAVDPGRGSLTLTRRSTVSAAHPPPLPSYVSIDAIGGGVGESPVPHVKTSKDAHRISIASIFSFGGLNRKPSTTHPFSEPNTPRANRSRTRPLHHEKEKIYEKPASPVARGSVSSDAQSKSGTTDSSQRRRPREQQKGYGDRREPTPTAIDEDDYINSYYETLLPAPDHHDQTRLSPVAAHPRHSPSASSDSRGSSQRRTEYVAVSRQTSASTTSAHPYAYAFPSTERAPPPQTAPLLNTPHTAFNPGPSNPPRLVFTTPSTAGPSSAGAFPPTALGSASGSKPVKNSVSTPNLRDRFSLALRSTPSDHPAQPHAATARTKAQTGTLAAPTFAFPKGKERWLSAETWCDAVLFPRPRLRIKQDIQPNRQQLTAQTTRTTTATTTTGTGTGSGAGSGRIVSPPVTPTEREFEMQRKEREPGVASRVLAHSRSLVDLRLGKGKKKAEVEMVPREAGGLEGQRGGGTGSGLRPPRPKSFAMDDLALPSPVPSLAHVLREGALLQSERKEWQRQAQRSFGNTRSRTVSRTRSKSLTQRARRQGHHPQSSMEYIAAQACLGSQNHSPAVAPPRLAFFDGASSNGSKGTHSHAHSHSHSHSGSLVKTLTKSTTSKAHSRTHSRTESGSKPAPAPAPPAAKAKSNSGLLPIDPFSGAATPAQQKAADLEGALRNNGTRVIRLADPAHLPLDRGAPGGGGGVQRKTPSPAFSAISDSRVGIALGTPPEEDSDASVPYMPAHPYARGGLSLSNAGAGGERRHADFAGPHPSVGHPAPAPTTTTAPPIADILARHRMPPHMVLHPYAQPAASSRRNSYIDANGLVGQFRSEAGTPHAGRMWAQLSPSSDGVVQEVLPDDLVYSPYSPEAGHGANRQTLGIHDIVGLGETLVNAARYRRASPDSGLGTSESHGNSSYQDRLQQRGAHQPDWDQPLDLPEFGPAGRQREKGFDTSRFGVQGEMRSPTDTSVVVSNHTLASSNYDYLSLPPPEHQLRNPSPASAMTSESSSPQQSPQPLGSPHDLDSFQDLFFRPNMSSQRTPNEAALPESPHRASIPWDNSMRTHRTDSSLTNLARQLSDEFEQMERERERERSSSLYSQSVTSSLRQQSSLMRRPTEGSLQFVFEEMHRSASPTEIMADPIHAFKASETLPEDVISSRASSFIEGTAEDDDPTAVFRVGMVESVSTPPAVSSERRLSYTGQTTFANSQDQQQRNLASPASQDRILSGLQAPLTEATRSSYMTSSTLSRMSNLSDFPAPPKDSSRLAPKHMSLLSSYFDEAMSNSEAQEEVLPAVSSTSLEEDRVTFGGNQSANDLAKTLSSPQPEPF